MEFKKLHFIINPASGQPQPILSIINRVLREYQIEWTVSITQKDGHGRQLAQEAMQTGIDLLAVCGGDGTVKDVVNGLIGSPMPLLVLPGGTGNALAHDLGIPTELDKALALVIGNHTFAALDAGKTVRGSQPEQPGYFLLRANMGLTARISGEATREDKDRFGNLAYVMTSLRSLAGAKPLSFQLTIDGQEIEGQGFSCIVANSAAVGGPAGFRFAPDVSLCDGVLDVFIIDANFNSFLSMVSSNTNVELGKFVQRWPGREIAVRLDEPQPVVIDGEDFGQTPVTVSVIPQAVRVMVPGSE